MNTVELLQKQTEDTYAWTNKLLSSIPHTSWEVIPEILESNISWQTGHLILSIYYHSILVITGHNMNILKHVPLKEYDTFFTQGSPKESVGQFSAETLYNHLVLVQEASIQTFHALNEEVLEQPLLPTPLKHPIATTKSEAIDWNIKHTMWHCGQIGMLKRIVHERYDFKLRR